MLIFGVLEFGVLDVIIWIPWVINKSNDELYNFQVVIWFFEFLSKNNTVTV